MFEIKTLNAISNKIYDVFDDCYNVTDNVESPDAILVRSAKMQGYDIGKNLLAIARAGAGVNNIPLDEMSDKGIVVFNTPGANANAVKELVLCGMLLSARDILGGISWVQTLAGNGDEVPALVEKGKKNFGGNEIAGKTIGIVGLGAIGMEVAKSAFNLGLNVIGYDPFLSEAQKNKINFKIEIVDNLDAIYATSDFVTIHVPLLSSTKNMICAESIAKMKKGVVILNMARGELVCADDIKNALASGQVKNYVVDFPSEAILCTKGIIAIPHLGASTEESEENCAVMAASQLKDFLENGNIKNSVNFPNISAPRTSETRITIAYNSGTEALDEIKKIVAPFKFSFAEKNGLGYAIIDCNSCNDIDISAFTETADVLMVRII